MNATETRDYIVNGFAELKAMLEDQNVGVSATEVARRAAAGHQEAQERVREEYAQFGMIPPSPFAFSISTRLELGTAVIGFYREEDAA